eukprot:2026355-Rhodomonas_salina.1
MLRSPLAPRSPAPLAPSVPGRGRPPHPRGSPHPKRPRPPRRRSYCPSPRAPAQGVPGINRLVDPVLYNW